MHRRKNALAYRRQRAEAEVIAAMHAWGEGLMRGSAEDPASVTGLYAEDAVLWGTISRELCSTPAAIEDYFVGAYRRLPRIKVQFHDPRVQVSGYCAVNSGRYTFTYERDGQSAELRARFTFVLAKRRGRWLIINHHSSALPG